MKRTIWFYKFNDEHAKKHRAAYEKSLNSNHATKVHSGSYYYRGYEIDFDSERQKDCQWKCKLIGGYSEDVSFAGTKVECMKYVDNELKEQE